MNHIKETTDRHKKYCSEISTQ